MKLQKVTIIYTQAFTAISTVKWEALLKIIPPAGVGSLGDDRGREDAV